MTSRTGFYNRALVFGLAFLLFFCAAGHADQLHLKSGPIMKGKVTAVNDNSYTFAKDPEGQIIEVPFSNVWIADIDPANTAARSHVIFFSESGRQARPSPPAAAPKRETGPMSATAIPTGDPSVAFKKSGDVLKYASDTVALSNARTKQMESQLEKLQEIANAADKK